MKIVKIHKSHICSLCLKPIEPEEEAFMFYSKQLPTKGNLKLGHITLKTGLKIVQIHFRHFSCQYEVKPRKASFEEYLTKVRKDQENRKKKLKERKEQERIKTLYGIAQKKDLK